MSLSCEGCRVYNERNSKCNCMDLMETSDCPCRICLIKMVCKDSCPRLKSHIVDFGHYRM